MRISPRPCPRMPTSAKRLDQREAPPSYVTGGRGRLASVPGGPTSLARQGSLASSPAPPGAPSRRCEGRKKGRAARRPQKNPSRGEAERWLLALLNESENRCALLHPPLQGRGIAHE